MVNLDMPAQAEVIGLRSAPSSLETGSIGPQPLEIKLPLPDYKPLNSHLESRMSSQDLYSLDIDTEFLLAARWEYETFIEKAQIGEKSGFLYNRFRSEKIDMPMQRYEKQNPNASDADILEQTVRLEAQAQKRVDNEGLVADESRKRANEELEKIRAVDPEFARKLQVAFGELKEEEPAQEVTTQPKLSKSIQLNRKLWLPNLFSPSPSGLFAS